MLYGMDDHDFENLSLVKKSKLNMKKVILVIIIFLLCFFIMFGSFSISYRIINKQPIDNLASTEIEGNVNNNEKENSEPIKVTKEEKIKEKDLKNDETANLVINADVQIAEHNMEEIKKQFLPVQNLNAKQDIKNIYTSEEKQVYLTFDDGPSKNITPQILDILRDNGVKATFFVLGSRVELYSEILKREFNEGHYIANHGYSHSYKSIYESKDTTFSEYVQCENAIKNALGIPEYNSYLFRFPGGSSGGSYSSIKKEARDLFDLYGVAYTNWNCLTGDAAGSKTKEECMAEMISTKANQNSIILLMHDAGDKSQTVEALPEIIQYYKNEGYTFKNFYEIFK